MLVALVQYMEASGQSNTVDDNSCCICLGWSSSDKTNNGFCVKELEGGVLNFGEQ